MTLISLLIALAAERILLSRYWQFNFYYGQYVGFARGFVSKGEISRNIINLVAFALLPASILSIILWLFDHTLIDFVVVTLVLIVCIGSQRIRDSYKNYLNAAMRGDQEAVVLHQDELQQGQQFEGESFGQTLVWMNYQYYMALMLIFIFFGIFGVVFYRILVAVANQSGEHDGESFLPEAAADHARKLLFYIDIIPTRAVAFGYMLVGHFSKASTLWLEGMLNFKQSPRQYLCEVAEIAEDYQIDDEDCTAEPCLLVRLAKRNVLLLLAATAFMTIAGVAN
ncbi:regulatory signaling modulator protein AmpE [Thalassotalea mangrovi]|uniref:Regulatory signaling modulator protein AmpE n=1 Tax=Thalassotalea mangrovi TaxID=2572245 RepID=A0A4U1B8Q6_9GAMM|nr:regulatory signaling modulator protein AmpE [Thalassotalea mangrovi]TKB47070.1 regulatory signaling modulator protein AmpE [Thalassotalea mangrovi]